jgi:hypothetical protein
MNRQAYTAISYHPVAPMLLLFNLHRKLPAGSHSSQAACWEPLEIYLLLITNHLGLLTLDDEE